ncbi:hypothetical protein AB6A40_000996 [Gnathostoma spinigerum]|uniref:ANK_REP_REGION domain-containing protein n=1 Tax=Gnathostoma spinigerum TaxID=75299 RepID=A0ABD6ECR1_9BILA
MSPIGSAPCCDNVFQCVRNGHTRCLEQLTREEVELLDHHGQSALHLAARLGRVDIVEMLLKKAPELQDVISVFGENAALVAAGEGNLRCLQRLLQGDNKCALRRASQRDVNGSTVLMAAVARGDNEMAFWLLEKLGKSIALISNIYHMIPLHVAAAQGNTEFVRIATKYDTRMVHCRDDYGATPAAYAVQGGNLQTVRHLIEVAGSELSAVTDRGKSLLHIACLSGHAHIVRWILQRSIPNYVLWMTNDKANSIHCAAYSGSVTVLGLLCSGLSRRRRRHIFSIRDGYGNTPLHLAVVKNHPDACAFLIDGGADPDARNGAGLSCLEIAHMRNFIRLEAFLHYFSKEKRQIMDSVPRELSPTEQIYIDTFPTSTFCDYNSRPTYSSVYDSPRMTSPLTSTSPARALCSPNLFSQMTTFDYGPVVFDEGIVEELEVRPMIYIASDEGGRLYTNSESQTDPDPLTKNIRIVESNRWEGEAVASIEQLNNVLDEVDEQ